MIILLLNPYSFISDCLKTGNSVQGKAPKKCSMSVITPETYGEMNPSEDPKVWVKKSKKYNKMVKKTCNEEKRKVRSMFFILM